MIEQFDAFEALARDTDPETSTEAALRMTSSRSRELQAKALLALHRLGGAGINDEIVEASGEAWRTITPRMRPLERAGYVHEGPKRKAESGRSQVEWSLTARGRAVVEELLELEAVR